MKGIDNRYYYWKAIQHSRQMNYKSEHKIGKLVSQLSRKEYEIDVMFMKKIIV